MPTTFHMIKVCKKCQNSFPASLEFFYRDQSTKDGLRGSCKTCILEQNKKWSIANKDKHRDLIQRWTVENKERHLRLQRDWYTKNREYHLQRSKEWSANNLDKKAKYRRDRRARISNANGNASLQQTTDRLAYHGYKCVFCGLPYTDVEHAFPLSEGGTNWPANLFPSCQSCNSRKFKSSIWEFCSKNPDLVRGNYAGKLYARILHD